MKTEDLITALKIASASEEHIPKKFLMIDAALKLQKLESLVNDMKFWMNYIQSQSNIGHIHDTASSAVQKIREASDK